MNRQVRDSAAFITEMGMVSPLGNDVVSSCAAYRAGLLRLGELSGYMVLAGETREPQPVLAHQVPVITDGFCGAARLLRIGAAALEDLFSRADLRGLDHRRTGLYLALPDVERVRRNVPKKSEEHAWNDGAPGEEGHSPGKEAEGWGHQLGEQLLALVDCYVPVHNRSVIEAGQAGVIMAIAAAMNDLGSGRLDRCIVGGLDSYMDIDTLDWLQQNDRLKTEDNPAGVQPGEAGAFLLLETSQAARLRGGSPQSRVLATATAVEPEHLYTGRPSLGRGLAQAITQALSRLGDLVPLWILADHNGEPHRARELGYALTRVAASHPELAQATAWYPATSFGHTGAASGAIALCSAVRAFARHYAPSTNALIISSSDTGERAALCLTYTDQ